MKRPPTILEACRDPALFAAWFKHPRRFGGTDTWTTWLVFLAALFALPLTPEQLTNYQQCTGRSEPPSAPAREGWLVVGRRGGKSFILALIAVYVACFEDHRRYLAPGEVATIMIIARDRRQARVIKRFITGLLHGVPMNAA